MLHELGSENARMVVRAHIQNIRSLMFAEAFGLLKVAICCNPCELHALAAK